MTRTIIYKNKSYNGIFLSTFEWIYDIYIDRQARLAILIDSFSEVKAIINLETYQIDVLLDGDEEEIDFLDELKKLENKFEKKMYK